MRALTIVFGAWLCLPCFAQDDIDHCALPPGAHTTVKLSDFPSSIAGWTRGVSPRGGPLATDSWDPRDKTPQSRLVRAFQAQRRWVVISEHGGFANYYRMSVFAISRDGRITRNLSDSSIPISCETILQALQPHADDF